MDETSIQDSIDAILRVLNVHENHLYPRDRTVLEIALHHLSKMKSDGFK